METPEERGYCDFCKEPFRRKPPPPEPSPKAAVPPEVLAKLLDAKRPPEVPAAVPAPGIPAEFAHLDAGERIPELPSAARKAAWLFLAATLFAGALGLAYMAGLAGPRRTGARGEGLRRVPVGPPESEGAAAPQDPGVPEEAPPPPPPMPMPPPQP